MKSKKYMSGSMKYQTGGKLTRSERISGRANKTMIRAKKSFTKAEQARKDSESESDETGLLAGYANRMYGKAARQEDKAKRQMARAKRVNEVENVKQAGGFMGGKSIIGALGGVMKGESLKDMQNDMKYRKGGIKKAQSSNPRSGATRRMTEDDRMQRTGNTPSMRQGTGPGKSRPNAPSFPTVNTNNFKAGKSREEVQNTPGGTGSEKIPTIKADNKRIDPPKNIKKVTPKTAAKSEPTPKPKAESKAEPTSKPKPKNTYAEAKKKDPKLDQYIKIRNNSKKGSKEWIDAQNKINAAYGVGRQRDNIQETKSIRPNTKVAPASERTLQTRPTAPKPAASDKTSKQTKAKDKPVKESIVEDSKEVKFDGPSRRANRIENKADRTNKRKAKRTAVQSAKEKLRAARRS